VKDFFNILNFYLDIGGGGVEYVEIEIVTCIQFVEGCTPNEIWDMLYRVLNMCGGDLSLRR
jgi:hypothetical protein